MDTEEVEVTGKLQVIAELGAVDDMGGEVLDPFVTGATVTSMAGAGVEATIFDIFVFFGVDSEGCVILSAVAKNMFRFPGTFGTVGVALLIGDAFAAALELRRDSEFWNTI